MPAPEPLVTTQTANRAGSPQVEPIAEPAPLDDALQLQVLRLLDHSPNMSQRDLSKVLGLSLGKVNFCIRALAARGWIKVNNFRRSNNKLAYAYVLTPTGIAQKVTIARRFLSVKEREFEVLQATIERLRAELDDHDCLTRSGH